MPVKEVVRGKWLVIRTVLSTIYYSLFTFILLFSLSGCHVHLLGKYYESGQNSSQSAESVPVKGEDDGGATIHVPPVPRRRSGMDHP